MTRSPNGADGSKIILEIYKRKLLEEWTHKAYCGRDYILVGPLQAWLKRQEMGPLGFPQSNIDRLIIAAYTDRPSWARIDSQDIVPNYINVFAILLAHDNGHYIHEFHHANLNDFLLDSDLGLYYKNLKRRAHLGRRTDEIIENFDKARWTFSPVQLKLDRHRTCDFSTQILPFCERTRITEKGGTANVWAVLIKEEMMPEEMKEKIEKSLVDSLAPQGSIVDHEVFGRCYRLAIKSYGQSDEVLFDWERSAFEVLRGQAGMVQCFGSYEIDEIDSEYRRGLGPRTFNLVLEFGELDLQEYFANRDQNPPTFPSEIFSFWSALFKTAEALKEIHDRQFKTAKTTANLSGWHADIKPDNILRINGKFKLADFGFAKFKKKEQDVPSEYIQGGTESYGAPECDSARRARGTKTVVSQTIDTWSLGCVLSEAATWLILGPQGIKQYTRFRMASIRELQQNSTQPDYTGPLAHDAFHDGSDVLPDIAHWHDYLRNIARGSDTITSLVLALIDEHLLVRDPNFRYTSNQLCEELRKIESLANEELASRMASKKLLPFNESVERRLYEIDRRARHPNTDSTTTIGSSSSWGQPTPPTATVTQDADTKVYHRSRRIGKSERLDDHLAKTAHRDQKPQFRPIMTPRTESPNTLDESMQDLEKYLEATTPRSIAPSNLQLPHRQLAPGDTSRMSAFLSPGTSQYTQRPPPAGLASPPSYVEPPLGSSPLQIGLVRQSNSHAFIDANQMESSRGTGRRLSPKEQSMAQFSPRPILKVQAPSELSGENLPPAISRTTSGTRRPSGPLQQAAFSDEKELSPLSPLSSNSQAQETTTMSPVALAIGSYSSINDVKREYGWLDIFKVRDQLDGEQPGAFKKYLGKGKKDEHLGRFIVNRDIVFLVDNASSMMAWWDLVAHTVETLAMNLAGLDDDGLDLMFTLGNERLKLENERRGVAAKFLKQVIAAKPTAGGQRTNMADSLSAIFDSYIEGKQEKRMTVLIFTDGLWAGGKDDHAVEKAIAQFIPRTKDAKENRQTKRRFSIQFVSFGNDTKAMNRLTTLDDEMERVYSIPDIIDHEPWTGKVEKMILGSFNEAADVEGPEAGLSPPHIARTNSRSPSFTSTTASKPHRKSLSSVFSLSKRNSKDNYTPDGT